MKTELCDVLGIEYPIIQGAMAHISDGKFAATVSEAGGLGVIASTLHDGQWVKEQVEIARSITDKPFAVNLIMESDIVEECARMCVELKVADTSARCARSLWCARLLKRWTSPLSQRVA